MSPENSPRKGVPLNWGVTMDNQLLFELFHSVAAAGEALDAAPDRYTRFGALAASLDALSPLKVLGRGYALAQQPDGTVLRSADQARIGETLRLRLADGALRCQVKEKENEHGSKKDV